MGEAYIVGAVRTAAGKRRGKLAAWHPIDLGGKVLAEVVERTGINPEIIDDVIFGCVDQVGAQSANIARNAILAGGLPESVPGTTVDRQCGSSQQAVHFAAQAVMSGVHDVVIAAGVEVMSQVPLGANAIAGYKAGYGVPYGEGMKKRYPGVKFSQFDGAELLAEKWGLDRSSLDAFGAESHRRAAAATGQGHFSAEIVPVDVKTEEGEVESFRKDEGIRPDTTTDVLAGLRPLSDKELLTAGTSSQISDGAAAILIVNEEGLRKCGAAARARIHTMTLAAEDPIVMLGAPIPATQKLLDKTGMKLSDIGAYEINEAFASVPMAWAKAFEADMARLNPNGGAIALGHPLGCTGAKLMTTLLHHMERTNQEFGLQSMCEGGGLANATLLQRV